MCKNVFEKISTMWKCLDTCAVNKEKNEFMFHNFECQNQYALHPIASQLKYKLMFIIRNNLNLGYPNVY